MANPNIVNVSAIYGNTGVQAVSNVATAIVTNSAASGKVYKVNSLVVTNTDTANVATITVDLYRSTTAYKMSSNVSINASTTYTPIDKTLSLYLLEGDAIRLTANANSMLTAVCSWEEIN
jgi:pyruvate/2-oxoacid:ferredoxin oxidoreductase beta subunit